jgi:peptidoglycan/LPS O-acetylase OafA/YrhL
MRSADQRLAWVDTLRGTAVLCVFALHTMLDVQRFSVATGTPVAGLAGLQALTFGWLDFGKIGVAIFFIVSGFLIPITLDSPSPSVSRDFAINRFFRLYPAYWASIGCFLIFIATPLSRTQIAINFSMFQRFVAVPDLNGVFWTLQIELVFYALCVLLKWRGWLGDLRVLKRLVVGIGACAVLLAAARYVTGIKLPVALLLALQLMVFGYLYRLWFVDGRMGRRELLRTLVPIVITLAVACPLAYSRNYGLDESWSRYLASYVLAVIIFGVVSRLDLHTRWLSFVGKVSYSFYLTHAIVVSVVVAAVMPVVGTTVEVSELTGIVLVSAACSLLIASVLFAAIEDPGIRAGRYILKRLGSPLVKTRHAHSGE